MAAPDESYSNQVVNEYKIIGISTLCNMMMMMMMMMTVTGGVRDRQRWSRGVARRRRTDLHLSEVQGHLPPCPSVPQRQLRTLVTYK